MANIRKVDSSIFEEKSSLSRKEGYLLWKIRKGWHQIVGDIIAEKSEIYRFSEGELVINVYDSVIYHNIMMYTGVIIEKTNMFLSREAVKSIDIRKINRKRGTLYGRIFEKNMENNEKYMDPLDKETNHNSEDIKNIFHKEKRENIPEEITLSEEEMNSIRRAFGKIEGKYKEIGEKLFEIAKNNKIREKYLLNQGFIKCGLCGKIFLPGKNEKICFSCYEHEENKKLLNMKRVITDNPLVGEREAILLSEGDSYTYYKARDLLAQQAYNELLYFFLEKKDELKDYSEYSTEIKNEIRTDFEIYVKNFIDFNIGTDSKEIFMKERKRILRKLRREEEFRKKV